MTTAGDALLRTATQVLDMVGRTEDEIRKAGKSDAGLLRITTQCYTCYHWLPGLLKEYRLRHPTVEVQVDADATPRPITSLLEGRIDLAIVSDRFRDRRSRQPSKSIVMGLALIRTAGNQDRCQHS